jgi:hypothetical protein
VRTWYIRQLVVGTAGADERAAVPKNLQITVVEVAQPVSMTQEAVVVAADSARPRAVQDGCAVQVPAKQLKSASVIKDGVEANPPAMSVSPERSQIVFL